MGALSAGAVQVTFQGDTFFIRGNRSDGTVLSLNTRDHLYEVETDLVSPITGRNWDYGTLFDYDASSATAMYAAVDYDPNDYGDWISGGYWLHVRGNWRAGAVTGVEIGAFVDGPEISGPASVPVTGTATYNGTAGGLAFTRTGSDSPDGIPVGTYEALEYTASFRAVADFSDMTISASIYDIGGYGYQAYPDGTLLEGYGTTPGTLHYGPTPIAADGTWSGTAFSATDPRFTFTTVEGSWGGQFSTIDDANGDPRLVAGTHGGRIVSSGGSESVFIGGHHAVTDNF